MGRGGQNAKGLDIIFTAFQSCFILKCSIREMAVSLSTNEGLSIPTHVQEKLSTSINAPGFDDWLTERLSAEHKDMYLKLLTARCSSNEKFPVDFDILWQQLCYTRKDTAVDLLYKNFVENDDFILVRSKPEQVGQHGGHNMKRYLLTITCAQQFSLLSGTEVGKRVRLFFVSALEALQDYHLLTALLAERHRGMEEKQKFLIQQNPKGTKVTYIAYIGMINGIHYWKVGSSDDIHDRVGGLRSDFNTPTEGNKLCLVDVVASPNNRAVEKAFHTNEEAKKHRVTLKIKGKNQTEVYMESKKFSVNDMGRLLRDLTNKLVDDKKADRVHEEKKLQMKLDIVKAQSEQYKEKRQTLRELVAAGLTGTDLKDALAIMFPSACDTPDTVEDECGKIETPVTIREENRERYNGLAKDFIESHMLPGAEFAAESKAVTAAFESFVQDKLKRPRTRNELDALRTALGGQPRGTRLQRGRWEEVVGYPPKAQGPFPDLYGFSGWKLKTLSGSETAEPHVEHFQE